MNKDLKEAPWFLTLLLALANHGGNPHKQCPRCGR